MRKALTAFAIVALLFVVTGCPGQQKKIADLEKQVADGQMKLTELDGTVQRLSAERDSLQKLVVELEKKLPTKPGTVKPPTQKGTTPGTLKPPTKK